MIAVVEEHDRLRAAGGEIGAHHRPEPVRDHIDRRQGVGGRPGWAGRGALAATGADVGVDGHMVAGGGDRAGRAEVEAAGAAGDAGTGMRAEPLVKTDVGRSVEGSHQVRRVEDRSFHRYRVAGIRAQIPVAQFPGREEGRFPGKIEDQVAT